MGDPRAIFTSRVRTAPRRESSHAFITYRSQWQVLDEPGKGRPQSQVVSGQETDSRGQGPEMANFSRAQVGVVTLNHAREKQSRNLGRASGCEQVIDP